jgi:hypothetical protein
LTVAPVRVPLYIASIQNFLKCTVLDVDYGLQKATWKKSLQNHEQKALTLRPVRTSSSTMLSERPYSHTHMHTHKHYTLYALTLHSTCTCASVLHATCTQIAHHAFLYQNAYDALTYTLTYPHSHLHSHSHHHARRHKRNLTRNQGGWTNPLFFCFSGGRW